MPTANLLPFSSPGTYADWNDGTAGSSNSAKLAAVQASGGNDIAQNGDGALHICTFGFGGAAPAGMVSISAHTFSARLKHDQPAARNADLYCRRSSTNYTSTVSVANGAYANYTAANLGGATIQASEFSTIEYGVAQNQATAIFQCDLMGLTITYTAGAGSMAFLVSSLAGAALGLAEMGRLARELYLRTGIWIHRDERLEAWGDIRGYRWPKTFVIGSAHN